MKKLIAVLASLVLLSGCAKPLMIENHEYQTYGLLNEAKYKNSTLCYEVPVGNIVLSVIFIETIIVPIYILGFDLYSPVGLTNTDGSCNKLA
jgi:hypothetical protein